MTGDGSIDRTRIARRERETRRLPRVLDMHLQHRIGSGGEGEVWAAVAPDGTPRAVKLIRPDVVAEPVAFTRRAEALAQIDDPALVQVRNARVLSAGRWSGWGAMVMELIEGEPLDGAHLGAAAYSDLEPLALALDRLHEGVWSDGDPLVHRDIKPSNLIRADDGRIVLVDPSGVRAVGGDMTYVGTPLFVAPEVPSGRVGPPADVYSFAATLLALHSGVRGDELADLLDDPAALDVPDPVVRALSPVPDERPTRCTDLVDTTQTVVLRARSPVDAVPAAPQTSRTWWRLGLLTAAVVPIISGLLLPSALLALVGVAVVAGLLAIDPALRGPKLAWLPMSAAQWVSRTLDTDDEARARVAATIHGALVLPLTPLLGLLVGYGPRMAALGSVGQATAVAFVSALTLTWLAVLSLGGGRRDGQRWFPTVRAVLLPLWMLGAFLQALGRLVAALDDALRATDAERRVADAERRAAGEDHGDAQAADDATG